MIKVQSNFSLKKNNTFGINEFADSFCSVSSLQQLSEALAFYAGREIFVLGGGSNMLITQRIINPIIHVNLKGIEVTPIANGEVLVRCQAGENWHEFVMFCIDKGYAGIENMALIPGNVGTAPIQNIGAYGMEIKDTLHEVQVIDMNIRETRIMSRDECKFGYRDSVFKNELKGQLIITSVVFKLQDLNLNPIYSFNTAYGDIEKQLAEKEVNLKSVAQAVINIRQSKLPDPKELGNSGSFFKNPVIEADQFEKLKSIHPNFPGYAQSNGNIKVPAGWLIEQSGLKGYRIGDAGVHKNQALVLVNHGTASGQDILNLSKHVQKSVYDKFGVKIEAEVNVV